MTGVLVIDNYDSFVFTLVGYLQELGAKVDVIRNDEISLEQACLLAESYDGLLLSPGPGAPEEAGFIVGLTRWAAQAKKPLLGICLGHQAIACAFGARVSHAPELMHGKTSQVFHEKESVLAGVPSPFTATRYHSLAVEEQSLPPELTVTARTENGIIMGLRHRQAPLEGLQFHPESILTQAGHLMLGNWLQTLGLSGAQELAKRHSPLTAVA